MTFVAIGALRVNCDLHSSFQFQGFSYLSEIGARGLLNFGKKNIRIIKIGKI